MLMGMLLNLILDPLFIFGLGPFPRLELKGAAIATVIARAFTFALAMYVLYGRKKMITFNYPGMGQIIASWRQILYISLPAAASNIIIPVSIAIITRIIASYGPEAVAAFGVASRIDMFALIIVMALHASLAPFVGQNMGAGRFDRVRLGIRYSQQFALLWGLFVCIVLLFGGRLIASLFSDNEVVISTITVYFWIVPIGYGMQGILRLSCQALNIMRRPIHSALLGSMQAFLLYIPLACLGSEMIGLEGIFAAASISNVLAGIAAFLLLKKVVSSIEASVVSSANCRSQSHSSRSR
jgi:Na+-driven multidrug efflux pump